jgi:hypothetical protein
MICYQMYVFISNIIIKSNDSIEIYPDIRKCTGSMIKLHYETKQQAYLKIDLKLNFYENSFHLFETKMKCIVVFARSFHSKKGVVVHEKQQENNSDKFFLLLPATDNFSL